MSLLNCNFITEFLQKILNMSFKTYVSDIFYVNGQKGENSKSLLNCNFITEF